MRIKLLKEYRTVHGWLFRAGTIHTLRSTPAAGGQICLPCPISGGDVCFSRSEWMPLN